MGKRLSNIELLRIISIFLVMIAHCNSWLADGLPDVSMGDGIPISSLMRYFVAGLASICIVCFVFISGFFSIKPNLRSLITLWTQILFIKLIFYIIQCVFHTSIGVDGFEIGGFVKQFFIFTTGNWFVVCYLLLMLFAQALNLFSQSISYKSFSLYILLFTAAAFVYGCIFNNTTAGFNHGYSPLSLFYLYMVGRYIALHREKITFLDFSKITYLIIYLVLSALIGFLAMKKIQWALYYCNPLLVLSGVSLFMFFLKCNMNENKVINWIASSVFAVFIFHTAPPIVNWLKEYNIYALNTFSYAKYAIIMLCVLLVIFIVAILLDKLRYFVFRPLINFVSNIKLNFGNKINTNNKQ